MSRYTGTSIVIGLMQFMIVVWVGSLIFGSISNQIYSSSGIDTNSSSYTLMKSLMFVGFSPIANTAVSTVIPLFLILIIMAIIMIIFGVLSRVSSYSRFDYSSTEKEDDDDEIETEISLDSSAFKIFNQEETEPKVIYNPILTLTSEEPIKKQEEKVEVPQSKPINRTSSKIVYQTPELIKKQKKGIFWIKK